MGLEIPSKSKILLESNLLKSRMFVRRLAVSVLGSDADASADVLVPMEP